MPKTSIRLYQEWLLLGRHNNPVYRADGSGLLDDDENAAPEYQYRRIRRDYIAKHPDGQTAKLMRQTENLNFKQAEELANAYWEKLEEEKYARSDK